MGLLSRIFGRDLSARNISSRTIKKYGWVRDTPDFRDFAFSAPREVVSSPPPKVDLRPNCPPIFNQESLGSCTANAISAAHMFNQMKQKSYNIITPSRLFIYYNERAMEGTIRIDSGAQIRDGIKSVSKKGVCPENMWEYNISKFAKKPSFKCYWEAIKHQALQYSRIPQTLNDLKGCLACGFPFVFGFAVYESFESRSVSESGIVSLPRLSEKLMGGHAVMCVGYDDTVSRFIVQNSWGSQWGMGGYFLMPYEYITNQNLASDFWTIKLVE